MRLSPVGMGSIIVMLVAASACGTTDATGDAAATPVTVAIVPSAEAAQVLAGIDDGFFADHGLTVKTVPSATGPASAAQVVSGAVQFGMGADSVILNARASGIPLVAVAAAASTSATAEASNSQLVVGKDSDILSFRDLPGHTVGVVALKNDVPMAISNVVETEGGDPGQVKFVQIAFSDMPKALMSGRVDAVGVNEPFLSPLLRAGARAIGSYLNKTYGDGVPYIYWYTSQRYAEEQPRVVERFRASIEESGKALTSDAAAARASIAAATQIDPGVVETMKLPGYAAAVDLTAFELVERLMRQYGYLTQPVDVSQLVLGK